MRSFSNVAKLHLTVWYIWSFEHKLCQKLYFQYHVYTIFRTFVSNLAATQLLSKSLPTEIGWAFMGYYSNILWGYTAHSIAAVVTRWTFGQMKNASPPNLTSLVTSKFTRRSTATGILLAYLQSRICSKLSRLEKSNWQTLRGMFFMKSKYRVLSRGVSGVGTTCVMNSRENPRDSDL